MIHDPESHPELEAAPTASEPNIIEPRATNRNSTLFAALRSLKQLQNETRAIEIQFFEHVYQLESEFQIKHDSVYQKRFAIVNGQNVPVETENHFSEAYVGVPHFWLQVLTLSLPDIHENDRPILEHLIDVQAKNKPFYDQGLVLEFHFRSNEFFHNAVLTKEYFYTSSDDKMIHEIPLIRKSMGTEIQWKQGKAPRYDSWFGFLASGKMIIDSEEEFTAYVSGTQKDFEMGYFIKEHVIPKAVLYFTGEETLFFTTFSYNSEFWLPASADCSIDGSVGRCNHKSGSEDDSQDEAT